MADNYLSSVKISDNDYDIYAKSALSAGWVPGSAIDGKVSESSISSVPVSAIKSVNSSAITAVESSAIPEIAWSAISGLAVGSGSDTTAGIWTPSSTREYVSSFVAGKISNVYKFQGSVSTTDLPANPDNGDVYNLIDAGTINTGDATHSARVDIGDNVAWVWDSTNNSGYWDKLAAVDASAKMDITAFETWTGAPTSTFSGSAASANTAWIALNVSGASESAAGQDLINSAKSGAAASAWIEAFTGGAAIVNVDTAYMSGDGSTGSPIGINAPGSDLTATDASALVNAGAISSFVNTNYIAKSDIRVENSHQLVIDNL